MMPHGLSVRSIQPALEVACGRSGIEYAQHALLSQIQLAITSNKNVVTPRPDFECCGPFCWNGCIIISHSTGPLVCRHRDEPGKVGSVWPGAKRIPDYIMPGFVAGAISGTRIATIGMAIGLRVDRLRPSFATFHSFAELPCSVPDLSFVSHTILRDLMPFMAQGIWGFGSQLRQYQR